MAIGRKTLFLNLQNKRLIICLNKDCELIILACNTASAEALRKIQQEWLPLNYSARRVLGVIRPTVEEGIKLTKNNRIGVIGTEGTISSMPLFAN